MAKYEITILINVLCPSPDRGEERPGSVLRILPVFLSPILCWLGLGWDHRVGLLFTIHNCVTEGGSKAGCKVRDVRQFRHLSVTSLSSHSACVEEREEREERGEILLQTLVMHHCCPASHNILLTFPSLARCHFKQTSQHNNEWKLDAWLRVEWWWLGGYR